MNKVMKYLSKEQATAVAGTLTLVGMNVVVFLLLNLFSDLAPYMLLDSALDAVLARPWTLVTVFFSNELLIHLLLNMTLMVIFGLRLEKMTGTKVVVAVYVVAGLAGALAFPLTDLFMESRPGLIAGASAAAMSMAGAYGVLRPDELILKSKAKWWVVVILCSSTAAIFIIPQSLDSGIAHITGVLIGVLVGLWIRKKGSKQKLMTPA